MSFINKLYRIMAIQSVGFAFQSRWTAERRIGNAWECAVFLEGFDRYPIAGFAVDPSRRLAPVKALMEALEGLALRESGLRESRQSRSGIAAHFTLEKARAKAYEELVERDALLFHWFHEHPGKALPGSLIRKALRGFESFAQDWGLRLIELLSADPEISVVWAAGQSRFGCWVTRISTGSSLEEAARNAVMNWVAAMNAHQIAERCPHLTYSEHSASDPTRAAFAEHHLQTGSPAVSALMEHIFKTDADFPAAFTGGEGVERAKTRFVDLKTHSDRYHVVAADHPDLMPILFSKKFTEMIPAYLENRRMKKFQKSPLKFHPDGKYLLHPMD